MNPADLVALAERYPPRPHYGDAKDAHILAPGEWITDPDRAEALGLTADARRMRGEAVGDG